MEFAPFCPRPGFQKRFLSRRLSPYDGVFTLQDFAEFFAELCALHAPLAPIAPFYSVENITTPAFTTRLLTERLGVRIPPEEPILFKINNLGKLSVRWLSNLAELRRITPN